MKITKFGHACLLVETPDRTTLFDPGSMSAEQIANHTFVNLDDIVVTHEHGDHIDMDAVKKLVEQFPNVRITTTPDVVEQLKEQGIAASTANEGFEIFKAEHEDVEPLFPHPQNIGVNYLGTFTHPGDSLTFDASLPILALPVAAPWGSTVDAVKLAIKLKPKYVIPIHDWHWNDDARGGMYVGMAAALQKEGITFIHAVDGEPFNLEV